MLALKTNNWRTITSLRLNDRYAICAKRATLECDCEHVRLTGRKWIAAYWAPKLESKAILAFCLNDMALTADGVRVGYQDHEGKPLRMDFHFGPSGKILHTSCARCCTT